MRLRVTPLHVTDNWRTHKSRKVAGYVKVVRKWEALDRKATMLHADMMRRRAALTGGQLAEAQRVLVQGEST